MSGKGTVVLRRNDFYQVFDQQKKVVRVGGARLETPVQIPITGGIIFGMHQDSSDTYNIGSLKGSQQGVLEQGATKTGTLIFTVNRKPGQNHYRYRMTSQARPAAADGSTLPTARL